MVFELVLIRWFKIDSSVAGFRHRKPAGRLLAAILTFSYPSDSKLFSHLAEPICDEFAPVNYCCFHSRMTWTHQIVTRLIDHSINFFARFLFAFCSLFVCSFPYKLSVVSLQI